MRRAAAPASGLASNQWIKNWRAMRVNEGGEVVRPFPVRGKPSSGSPLLRGVWTGCHTVLFTVDPCRPLPGGCKRAAASLEFSLPVKARMGAQFLPRSVLCPNDAPTVHNWRIADIHDRYLSREKTTLLARPEERVRRILQNLQLAVVPLGGDSCDSQNRTSIYCLRP